MTRILIVTYFGISKCVHRIKLLIVDVRLNKYFVNKEIQSLSNVITRQMSPVPFAYFCQDRSHKDTHAEGLIHPPPDIIVPTTRLTRGEVPGAL